MLEQERRGDRAARRAEHLQHDGIVDPAVVAGGDRTAEHQDAGGERDQRYQVQRRTDRCDHSRHRGQTLAHRDRRDVRESFGDLPHQRVLALPRRDIDRGEMGLRRGFERARREHDREIDPEPRPVDAAQIGDRRGDLAAEQVDRQRIPDLQPHAMRQLGIERDERRPAVIGRPPAAGDDL